MISRLPRILLFGASDRACDARPFVLSAGLSVSILPAAAHIDLTTLSSRRSTTYLESSGVARVVVSGSCMGWNDLLKHLRHIKTTNPRRVVRRLTFSRGQKLGNLSNLSSATGGLLTHIDFSRSHRDIDFEELGINLPGLRGLGVSNMTPLTGCQIRYNQQQSNSQLHDITRVSTP